MAEFGKRNRAGGVQVDSKPDAAPADLATAIEVVKTGKLPRWANVGPIRLVLAALFAAGMLLFIVRSYGGDVLRDHRLAGTWQTAYDLEVLEGGCTTYQFVATICDTKLKALAEPDRSPLEVGFLMLFTGGGGESIVPVRSTVDPSAVSIAYAAETELTNRTMTFIAVSFIFAAMFLGCVSSLLRGKYRGGAAHRALIAGFAELKARVESPGADPRAAA
jgi:hypothetical protein